ncbi:MAG: hypothetical protein RIQ62_1006 [Bacteroidota bacterium]|jgi:hypothetical protein
MVFITLWDYVLLPFYLLFLFIISIALRPLLTTEKNVRYYYPALGLKVFGALMVGIIYQYYYKSGDTANYFNGGKDIAHLFLEDGRQWLRYMFAENGENLPVRGQQFFFFDHSSYYVQKLTSVVNFLTFSTYLNTALFFALFSFFGIWFLFTRLSRVFSEAYLPIAIALFFLPSVFFWGSGISKDTISIMSLCVVMGAVLNWFYYPNSSRLWNLILIIFFSYLLIQIKLYIFLFLLLSVMVFVWLRFYRKLKDKVSPLVIWFVFVLILLLSGFFFQEKILNTIKAYSIEEMTKGARITYDYIRSVTTDDGSGYNLGEINYAEPLDVLKSVPAAIQVTLFRPYPWESKKVITLFSAIESFAFLLFTIYLIFYIGFFTLIRKIWQHELWISYMIFALLFAFAIGFSTGNFGTLVRYKIPCMPFYMIPLLLIWYQERAYRNKLKKLDF